MTAMSDFATYKTLSSMASHPTLQKKSFCPVKSFFSKRMAVFQCVLTGTTGFLGKIELSHGSSFTIMAVWRGNLTVFV